MWRDVGDTEQIQGPANCVFPILHLVAGISEEDTVVTENKYGRNCLPQSAYKAIADTPVAEAHLISIPFPMLAAVASGVSQYKHIV